MMPLVWNMWYDNKKKMFMMQSVYLMRKWESDEKLKQQPICVTCRLFVCVILFSYFTSYHSSSSLSQDPSSRFHWSTTTTFILSTTYTTTIYIIHTITYIIRDTYRYKDEYISGTKMKRWITWLTDDAVVLWVCYAKMCLMCLMLWYAMVICDVDVSLSFAFPSF